MQVNIVKSPKILLMFLLTLEAAVNIELYPRYYYDSLDVLAKYNFSEINEKNEEKLKADSALVGFADQFNSNDLSRNKMSGAGPYRFVSWTADQNIVLEKKDDYCSKDQAGLFSILSLTNLPQ